MIWVFWPLSCQFGPRLSVKVIVASVGRPHFAPPHPFCVQCGNAGEASGTLRQKPHNESETEPGFTHPTAVAYENQPVFLISLSSLAEPNCHYGLSNKRGGRACIQPRFSSSFHHLAMSRPEPTGAETTAAGSCNPQEEGPEAAWLLAVAPGTYILWSFSKPEPGWPYFCLP